MSDIKEFAINAIRNLPDDITYDDIMELIFVQKKVARGMAQINNGESLPNEIVKKQIEEKLADRRNRK